MTYRWPKPEGISSAVTLLELELLQAYAHEAGTVLEIGTHFGFSCIGMALAGAHVTSVDPHYEGPANAPDTWAPFLANMRRHRLAFEAYTPEGGKFATPYERPKGTVTAFRATIESLPLPVDTRWALVFIDGDHVWPCPKRDAEIAQRHLIRPCPAWPDCADEEGPCLACAEYARLEGGYLAFHDVTPRWPGVWRATRELIAEGWTQVEQVQTLAVYHCKASSVSGMSSSPTEAL